MYYSLFKKKKRLTSFFTVEVQHAGYKTHNNNDDSYYNHDPEPVILVIFCCFMTASSVWRAGDI